jgi:pimeloyl-ACP methyl ester carboxylesterase
VFVLVLVRPRVRVRVRVRLELARAAGWIAENTLMGGDATSRPGSARRADGKELVKMRREAMIDGTLVSWLEQSDEPLLYVHGVPDSAELWTPLLERTGGIAVDLPGFGRSGKSAGWPYSLEGYAAFLPAFLDHLGLDRVTVVAHDWGAVALTLGPRIERLVAIDTLPLLPGHRWPWIARAWRTPVVGELAMGFTSRRTLLRFGGLSAEHADQILRHFDHGTQRAILKLYRSSRENLAELDAVTAPALVIWGGRDRYLGPEWADRIAGALGGETRVEVVSEAGHWPWLDRPEILQMVQDHVQLSGS